MRQSQEDTPVCAEISLRRSGASLQGIWQSETEGSLDSWRWKAVRVPWVPVLRAVSPGDSEPEEGQTGEQGCAGGCGRDSLDLWGQRPCPYMGSGGGGTLHGARGWGGLRAFPAVSLPCALASPSKATFSTLGSECLGEIW